MGSALENIKSIQFANTSVISAQIQFRMSALSQLTALGSSWYVGWQIQNKNGEKSKLKFFEIWTDKLVEANGQTGGGT